MMSPCGSGGTLHMDHEAWANEKFGKAMLRDDRRLRRLVSMGATLAERPSASVTNAFRSEREVQAAYDFLEHEDNEQEWRDVAVASQEACASRCVGYPYVLVIEDGSSWSFTDIAKSKGLGPIGTRTQGARGIKVMTSYAVSPEGVPLGVLGQVPWLRSDQINPVDHAQRPLNEKESQWWTSLQSRCDELMASYEGVDAIPLDTDVENNADAALTRDKARSVFGPEDSLFSKPNRPSMLANSISSQIRGRSRPLAPSWCKVP